MKHEKSDYAITKELIEFANEIDLNEEQQYQIKACQIILVDIFMPENEKEKMMKVVNMGSTFLENYERKLVETQSKKLIKDAEENGEKNGVKKGMKDATEKFARKLKEDNIPIEKIAQYTELSPNEIESL